jgi:hypothetical protein
MSVSEWQRQQHYYCTLPIDFACAILVVVVVVAAVSLFGCNKINDGDVGWTQAPRDRHYFKSNGYENKVE